MKIRTWCFSDLVVDATTGRMRESALWSNIGKLTMTWGFVYAVLHNQTSEFLWVAYGAIVIGHEIGARLLNQRQQKLEANLPPSIETTTTTSTKETK